MPCHRVDPPDSRWPSHPHRRPTANLPAAELSALVDGLVATPAGLAGWSQLRGVMSASPGGGALHVRSMALGELTPARQAALAAASASHGFGVSIEAGGSMCGPPGTGTAAAQKLLRTAQPFLDAGGGFGHVMLESIFSRTHAACGGNQTHATTAANTADFAKGLIAGNIGGKTGGKAAFFLYDALPHFAVGDAWPANTMGAKYGLELGAVLTALKAAMVAKGLVLTGHWLDSPYEYSRDYPSAAAPLPGGAGWKKVAAAVALVKGMGLAIGKTVNCGECGQVSAEAFYNGTMSDYDRTAAVVPGPLSGGHALDYLMVETWYAFPKLAIPEGLAYTTAYTALAVFSPRRGRAPRVRRDQPARPETPRKDRHTKQTQLTVREYKALLTVREVHALRAISLHIPKTAGTTVERYFKRCPFVATQPDTASAHLMTIKIALDVCPECDVIVSLRHPVERAISQRLWRMGYGRNINRSGTESSVRDPTIARGLPALPELLATVPDGIQARYFKGVPAGRQARIVPICSIGHDLPRLAAAYGCNDTEKVFHAHLARDRQKNVDFETRARLAEAYPQDLELWNRFCGSTEPW